MSFQLDRVSCSGTKLKISHCSVFNHYLRITPNSALETPDQSSSLHDSPPLPSTPPTPIRPAVTRRRETSFPTASLMPDPSQAGAALDDGVRRDVTRAVGGDGEGADPTLTHALLNSTDREGQWGRSIVICRVLKLTLSSEWVLFSKWSFSLFTEK